MPFRSRALEWAGVEPGEGRSVLLMTLHAFAMGLSTVFFETAASALFLERFGSGPLPFMYLAAAGVSIATGFVFTRLERRLSFRTLMGGTLVGLALSTAGFRAGLALSSAAWLVFGLLVWYRLISILTDLEYWAVAGRLYDVRQAKRLFGLIGSGEVVARIVGSLSVPLLLLLLHVPDLLVLSGLALGACLLLLRLVLREAGGAEEERPRATGQATRPRAPLANLLRDRYLVLLLSVAALGVLAKYLVDFAFLEQLRARQAEAKALATFFGLFSGLTQAGSLLVRLFGSGRLLRRHGVATGLLVLPGAHSLCALAVVGAGLAVGLWPGSGAQALVFWLVIANQGLYKVLKHPIDNASFKVLYQPLDKARRLATQIAVETILTPVMVGVAGVLMLVMSTALRYDPVLFSGLMLVFFGPWMVVARRAGRAYPQALLSALRGRLTHEGELAFDDAHARALLRAALSSDDPAESLFALALVERHAPDEARAAALELLRHPAPAVRRAALDKIGQKRYGGAASAVRSALRREPDPLVLAAALRALAALEGAQATQTVMPYLDHASEEVRRGALAALLSVGAPEALERLGRLTHAERADGRVTAARVVGDVARPDLAGLLCELLADGDLTVRRAALTAVGRLPDPTALQRTAEALADRRLRRTAAGALVAVGAGSLPTLAGVLASATTPAERLRLVRVLGRIRVVGGAAPLWEALGSADARVREAVLEAPAFAGVRADGDRQGLVEAAVSRELQLCATALTLARALPAAGREWQPLRVALLSELRDGRDRLLRLLALTHDPAALERVRDNLDHTARERRAYALEVLDLALREGERERVLPLLEALGVFLSGAPPADERPPEQQARLEALRLALASDVAPLRPWTRVLALAALAEAGLKELTSDVAACVASCEEPFVCEAARWALRRLLGSDGASGAAIPEGEAMETIERVLYLKGVRVFAQAPEDVLVDVARVLEERDVAAGVDVFQQGETGDSLYVVVSGALRVHSAGRTIEELGSHDVFGELALLDPQPRAATVTATTAARLLRLDREAFAELLEDHVEIVRGVVSMLCERLRHTVPPAAPASGASGP